MTGRTFLSVSAEVEAFARSLGLPGERLEAIHDYTHADGAPWWWVARWKNPTTGRKRPLPFHRTPEGFVRKMPEIPHGKRPLYRLHNLERYLADLVYLVEGEACADLLEGLGLVATTWPNGAQSVHAADWAPLAGRFVILWPDFDAPGFEAMVTARRILEAMGATVAEVDVEALAQPPKSDCVDFVEAWVKRHGKQHLHEIPDGHDLAARAVQELPWIEDRRAA